MLQAGIKAALAKLMLEPPPHIADKIDPNTFCHSSGTGSNWAIPHCTNFIQEQQSTHILVAIADAEGYSGEICSMFQLRHWQPH